MKTLLYSAFLFAAAFCFTACSNDDDIEVRVHDPNTFFEPAPDDNSEQAQIRRAFQAKYGSYLLFNDTIQRRHVGTNVNGEPAYDVEKLEIDYVVGQTGYAGNKYSYMLLTDIDEIKAGVSFLEENILPHMTGKIKPYSWLVCKQIDYCDPGKTPSHPYAAAGQRCVAVGTGILSKLKTDAQKQKVVQNTLLAILGPVLSFRQSELTAFFNLATAGNSLTIGADTEAAAIDVARRHGYLGIGLSTWSSYQTPSRDNDINQYASYFINYDDAYMEKNFAGYPVVLKRWYAFCEAMKNIGWVKDIN